MAVNAVLVAPAGTVIDDGTVTALLLLLRLTTTPPLPAAVLSVTLQVSEPAPVRDALLHDRLLSTPEAAVPVPVRLTTLVFPETALLVIVTDPLAAPVEVGSN